MTKIYEFEAGCYLELAMRDGSFSEEESQEVFNNFIIKLPSNPPAVEENEAYHFGYYGI